MYFSKALAALAAAAIFASVNAGVIQDRATTAIQIEANIKLLTTKSQALQVPAKNITPFSSLLGGGPVRTVIAGFKDIVKTVQSATTAMAGTEPFADNASQQAILDAFREFVRVHQQLLNIIIGKHGIISEVLFGPAIAAVLRSLETVVDTLAFAIIDLLGALAAAFTTEKTKLDGTVTLAIDTYSEP